MRLFLVILALVVAVPVGAVLVGQNRSGPPGGLTEEQAKAVAASYVRCEGGRSARRIVRCTAEDDRWVCAARDAEGDEQSVTVGGGYAFAPAC